jgi:hypothetical protein
MDIGGESHVENNVYHETWDILDVNDKPYIGNESCQGGNKIKVGDGSCHGDSTCSLFSQHPNATPPELKVAQKIFPAGM